MSPARRLKAVRELLRLTRPEMAEMTGIKIARYCNVEQGKVRMSIADLELAARALPEFLLWLAVGGPIDRDALRSSDRAICEIAALLIDTGHVPSGYGLEAAIAGGHDDKKIAER